MGHWMNEWVNQKRYLWLYSHWDSWCQGMSMWLWICPQILLKQPWTSKNPCLSLPIWFSQAWSSHDLWGTAALQNFDANCSVISIKLSSEWLIGRLKFLCRRTYPLACPWSDPLITLLRNPAVKLHHLSTAAAASVLVSADICVSSGGIAWRPLGGCESWGASSALVPLVKYCLTFST